MLSTGLLCVVLSFIQYAHSSDVARCPMMKQDSRMYMTTFKGTCYLFVDIEKNWIEARQHCWRDGGEMVVIRNMDTMNFIKETLNSDKLGWDSNGVWNGASDLADNDWEWTTGERLSRSGFEYWSPGEPDTLFLGISLENCCCMRRSDGWRWHDYHCHMDGYTYNFICQFEMLNNTATSSGHQNLGAPLVVKRDERVTIIVLLSSAGLLLIIISVILFYIYKQNELQKRRHEAGVRYQSPSYASVVDDMPPNSGDHGNGRGRPVSNIYLEPSELNNEAPPVYEQIAKETMPSRYRPSNKSEDTVPLMYVGGAASADNLSGAQSDASGATSGYCSGNTLERRKNVNDEYVEMSGDYLKGGNTTSGAKTVTPGTNNVGQVYVNSCATGATGTVADLKPSTEDLKGASKDANCVPAPQNPKSTNIYASPMTISDYILENGDSILKKDSKSDKTEMHIYCNKLDDEVDNVQRPLPPLPTSQ